VLRYFRGAKGDKGNYVYATQDQSAPDRTLTVLRGTTLAATLGDGGRAGSGPGCLAY
jgi:hypothetical protein